MSEYIVHEEEYKGHTIKIYQDSETTDPREWDNLGTMVCFHGRYNLGDKHDFSDPQHFDDWIDGQKVVILPLYLYDHSGITMNTTGYHCPWDSGQVGYIYVTHETIKKEFGRRVSNTRFEHIKRVSSKDVLAVIESLKAEVATYDDYITGNSYGYVIEDGDCDDSCWGFLGDYDGPNGALAEAKSILDHHKEEVAA